MDEEMEDIMTFTVVEIDLDYEFEAARYFDFSREESSAEAREAEVWFETAVSYPPSPFVKKLLLGENTQLGNVNTSPKSNGLESMTLPVTDSDTGFGHEHSAMDASNRGLTFYNHMMNDSLKAKTKSTIKPSFSRPSTLMKPTASQLAKQNLPRQVNDSRRIGATITILSLFLASFANDFLYSPVRSEKSENNEKSSNNSSGIESQAAKRQKLEGGQLRKVATNQQTNLAHKAPKKAGTLDGVCSHAKLGLTIPREPDLETAHRAQKMRPKSSRECQPVTSTARPFRALPLNRKILEAPSLLLPKRSTPRLPEFQEFHLKTSERAMQHTYAASSASVQSNNIKFLMSSAKLNSVVLGVAQTKFCISCRMQQQRIQQPDTNAINLLDPLLTSSLQEATGRVGYSVPLPILTPEEDIVPPPSQYWDRAEPKAVDTPQQEGREAMHKFRALPLNKKIFSSKGDIGVFRNSKRETTVPMEFNFHTEKKVQHDPPVELFNKLSLTSEGQPNAGSQLKFPQPTFLHSKVLPVPCSL
ncbi:hypothetical protein RJ639_010474 [Escallonia herrerae]|uniref:TPX2 central domain-containing protein n=1 Tax=Escallonia herrerae TaxID=1293975 RepID=A0AA88VNN9_9ASTE|nr:hypothetical protein RJ639_010474 [Escallonia herrerae]